METVPFREFVHQRFDGKCTSRMDRDTLMYIIAAAEEDELIEDVEDYLRSHPAATVYDTANYIDTVAPEQIIEIVDDELADDWED